MQYTQTKALSFLSQNIFKEIHKQRGYDTGMINDEYFLPVIGSHEFMLPPAGN